MSILNKGIKVDDIPVKISYRIIELFSAGLYSSPNKAFEELVSNSYDAFATKVAVYVPLDRIKEGALMWVCDNGTSMGQQGLKDLWMIGESVKKGENRNTGERLIIGRFGIGKLATYILTYDLTYICKSEEGYFAVSMDYSRIKKESEYEKLMLDEIKLTEGEAMEIIAPYTTEGRNNLIPFELWGQKSEPTWTFSIMTNLKPKASEISEGRLKWILKTALPLNPNFNLYYNGDKLNSTKINIDPLRSWVIGKNDTIIEKNPELYSASIYKEFPCVNLPNLKNVYGTIDLYTNSLVTNAKSEKWGRSHGIFLMVRGRLINLDDPLLGMHAMTHGVFNRIRMQIYADGLDEYIASTRENIQDVPAFKDLQTYIVKKFTEVRETYFNWDEQQKLQSRAIYKIAHSAASLSRRPLLAAAKKFFANEISSLLLTDIPLNLSKEEKKIFIERLESDLISEQGIIKEVKLACLRIEDPIAKFDLSSGIASVNLMHPFFANFIEDVNNPLPFQLFAVTEVLTEVSLIEQGVDEMQVKDIMNRRDVILRELTYSDKVNVPVVAALMRATLSDPDGLEDACTKAFASLGLETSPIGGNGEPDGIAYASLEHRGSPESYSITYDAKSTSKERIMASTAHISGVDRHRRKYKANYAVVVAIDFQGGMDADSAINNEAKEMKVNLIRAKDFITLILLSSAKFLGLKKLRDLFETCHTVIETSQWIDELKKVKVEKAPFKEILETTFELSKNDDERPKIAALRQLLKSKYPYLQNISTEKIITIAQTLETMVPEYISIQGEEISLQNSPDIILKAINERSSGSDIPFEFRDMFINAFTSAT